MGQMDLVGNKAFRLNTGRLVPVGLAENIARAAREAVYESGTTGLDPITKRFPGLTAPEISEVLIRRMEEQTRLARLVLLSAPLSVRLEATELINDMRGEYRATAA